ncbi:CCDC101 [Bugula neritina]|uniref:CCDC101 n=1 Tax=Bugula neritina TaxID=10212 RepID=A0A7J7KAF1_BUGNE|nr:CCDC101 [Bugula neritina]
MGTDVNPKLKEMLKELHELAHQIQEERNRGEPSLLNLQKVHDKIQQEGKVSPYYKSRLKGMYSTAIADAQAEAQLLQQAIDKIAEIKSYRNKTVTEPKVPVMRRGVLMSMVHKDAANLPLWKASTRYEKPPPLCGCLQADSSYIVPKGKYVAALVKGSEGEDNWILAEVVSFNSTTGKYDVDDIDSEEGRDISYKTHTE